MEAFQMITVEKLSQENLNTHFMFLVEKRLLKKAGNMATRQELEVVNGSFQTEKIIMS